MKNGFFQCTLDQIVVDGRPRHSQEESEFSPVSQQIGDRLAQTGVRFDFPFLEPGIRPSSQFFHHRSAVLLMEVEALIRRQALLPRLLVVTEDLAQRFQHELALGRKTRRHLHEVPTAVSVAVRHQRGVEFRHISR